MRIARLAAMLAVTLALTAPVTPTARAAEPLLIDAAALAAQRSARDVRMVDMADEVADYRRGHIPGAVHLDVEDARVPVPGRGYRLPNVDEAARLFGKLGLTPATRVVVYDDADGLNAAWLFYVLEALGHTRVAILDGGIGAWRRAGQPLTTEAPAIALTTYRPVPRPERVTTAEWIRDHVNDKSVALVDVRSSAEYTGAKRHARRGGVPGAVNLEWRQNLRADGTFKPLDDLRAMYTAAGVTPDKTVVTYCQTHHRGAHSYFVLRLLGYPRVVGYDRAWAEWGNRDELPVSR